MSAKLTVVPGRKTPSHVPPRSLIEAAHDLAIGLGLRAVMKSPRHLKIGLPSEPGMPVNFYAERGTVHIDGHPSNSGSGISVLRKICQDPRSFQRLS